MVKMPVEKKRREEERREELIPTANPPRVILIRDHVNQLLPWMWDCLAWINSDECQD